ncbi:MAG TPA: hypothetical protein VE733_18840 [Streptosporangiaceae bacterium]|nr:hypothetical protein [Streptosporangiaceae bacterium]
MEDPRTADDVGGGGFRDAAACQDRDPVARPLDEAGDDVRALQRGRRRC